MKSPGLLVLLMAILWAACDPAPDTVETSPSAPVVQDSIYEGEFRATNGGVFMLCGSWHSYKLAGAAAAEVKEAHASLISQPSAAAKVWVEGHLGTSPNGPAGPTDSVFIAEHLHHIAADLRCEAVPNSTVAGRYQGEAGTIMRATRHVTLDLFPGGKARLYTHMEHDGSTKEEQGHWGVNSDDIVEVNWPKREQIVHYTLSNGALSISSKEDPTIRMSLQRTGHADPEQGIHGEVISLLSNIVGDTIWDGPPLDEPLERWLSDGELKQFQAGLQSRYNISEHVFKRSRPLSGTLAEVIDLVRSQHSQ